MCFDTKAIRGECQSLINHFEDNPEDVTLMVGQKDSSKAVSTEALMTVFHPQDVENLDPKMVNANILLTLMPLASILSYKSSSSTSNYSIILTLNHQNLPVLYRIYTCDHIKHL